MEAGEVGIERGTVNLIVFGVRDGMGMMLYAAEVENRRYGGTQHNAMVEPNVAILGKVWKGTPRYDIGTATQTQPTTTPHEPKKTHCRS